MAVPRSGLLHHATKFRHIPTRWALVLRHPDRGQEHRIGVVPGGAKALDLL
jgi:hypothetical protein